MTAADKAKRLAEIEAERLQLERDECALVAASGGVLQYRTACDPRAVLSIEGVSQ